MVGSPRKVFLFAMPRSGSTLLCDRLTVAGKTVLLHEPMPLRRFGDGREKRVCEMLSALGHDVSGFPAVLNGTIAAPWFEQHVFPCFADYESWGIKEVYLTDAEQLIRRYQPQQILLLWRDPRDVAISFLELMNRALMSYSDRRTLKDEAWAFECLTVNAACLHRIASGYSARLLNYEHLMTSDEERGSLLAWLGLDNFGKGSFAMAADERDFRNAELQRHETAWSGTSIERWKAEPSGWRRTFAELCLSAMQPYATEAGYPGDRRLAEIAQAPATGSEVARVSDPKYMPAPSFDFAYAKRRGRQRVASLLSRGMKVLDVGGTTAALAFMTDATVTVIDDGATGKRVLSRQWRDSVFPQLDEFDTCTFISSLEFLSDPLQTLYELARRKCRLIITYHCLDQLANRPRQTLGFLSHLTRDDWLRFASQTSLAMSADWAFDGYQSLIVIEAKR